MQAIVTKYSPPTNHRGAAVVARCAARRIRVPWDDAHGVYLNHRAAAMALVERMDWTGYGYWIGGSLPDETGYAFTCAPRVGGAR